ISTLSSLARRRSHTPDTLTRFTPSDIARNAFNSSSTSSVFTTPPSTHAATALCPNSVRELRHKTPRTETPSAFRRRKQRNVVLREGKERKEGETSLSKLQQRARRRREKTFGARSPQRHVRAPSQFSAECRRSTRR